MNTVSVSGSFTCTVAVPSGPNFTRGTYSGTGVKFLRTEMFSIPKSPASSPPGFSFSGITPNAMARVSRAASRIGRSTRNGGSGSSGCSFASASTAWSTIHTVASPASGLPGSVGQVQHQVELLRRPRLRRRLEASRSPGSRPASP